MFFTFVIGNALTSLSALQMPPKDFRGDMEFGETNQWFRLTERLRDYKCTIQINGPNRYVLESLQTTHQALDIV